MVRRPTVPVFAPVAVAAIHALEPGDLLLGPEVLTARRVWWRLPDGGQAIQLLFGPDARAAARRAPDAEDPAAEPGLVSFDPDQDVVIVERDRDLPGPRAQAAACGSLWLHLRHHPGAPHPDLIRVLIADYAHAQGIGLANAWSEVATQVRARPGGTAPVG